MGTYVLTNLRQLSEQIGPTAWIWAVVAGAARGAVYEYEKWVESIGEVILYSCSRR
jgi:hypothetical protein